MSTDNRIVGLHENAAAAASAGSQCLFLWSASAFARMNSEVATALRNNFGIGTVLIGMRPKAGASGDAGDFLSIHDVEGLLLPRAEAELPTSAELASSANDLEMRLGVNLVDAIRTDRHVGIGFVSGTVFHRSDYGLSISFPQCLDVGLRLCAAFENLLRRYQPLAVVAFPGSFPSACLVATSEGLGIPVRWPMPSRSGKGYEWTESFVATTIGLKEAYEARLDVPQVDVPELTSGDTEMARLEMPERAALIISGIRRQTRYRWLAAMAYNAIRKEAIYRLRGSKKVYGHYRPLDVIRQTYQQWHWRRRMLRERPVMDRQPRDLPYIYYPLHIEPESTLMVEAQSADNQLTIIDWLVKAAPPGWYVVVKEHPAATTIRPLGFWRRVRAYPNVVVAATVEDSSSISARSKAVVDINGSVGTQAAVAGIPVVTVNPSYICRLMPHVLVATSYEDTRRALRRIRDGELPSLEERIACGKAFLAALEACSFPILERDLVLGVASSRPAPDEDVMQITRTMMHSLELSPLTTSAPKDVAT